MAQQSRTEKTQCFSSKMFQKNPQHPALLCGQDLKQDCVGAKRPPRNFKHPDLSPISAFWKDCSSAFHWCEEAVRVFWSNPSAPDCWTAAAPRTPKEFLGVQGVQTCNRCGRGCWPWWGLVFRLEAVENLGAILLFRTAPIERLCAMPMCHWREASKRNSILIGSLIHAELFTYLPLPTFQSINFGPVIKSPQQNDNRK